MAAADTHRGKAEGQIPALHFMKERHNQPRSGGADRMAEGNRAAVDVDDLTIQIHGFFNGQVLRGKSFIDFHQLNIFKRYFGFFEGNRG